MYSSNSFIFSSSQLAKASLRSSKQCQILRLTNCFQAMLTNYLSWFLRAATCSNCFSSSDTELLLPWHSSRRRLSCSLFQIYSFLRASLSERRSVRLEWSIGRRLLWASWCFQASIALFLCCSSTKAYTCSYSIWMVSLSSAICSSERRVINPGCPALSRIVLSFSIWQRYSLISFIWWLLLLGCSLLGFSCFSSTTGAALVSFLASFLGAALPLALGSQVDSSCCLLLWVRCSEMRASSSSDSYSPLIYFFLSRYFLLSLAALSALPGCCVSQDFLISFSKVSLELSLTRAMFWSLGEKTCKFQTMLSSSG